MLYYAAPMEGFTDRVWRQTHQKWFGAQGAADLYYAPFISPPENRVLIKKKMAELAPEANPGAPVIPQLLAKDGELAAWMIGQLRALGYTEVNLNLGCPAGTVTAKGKGSGMLRDLAKVDAFLDGVFSHAEGPVSVKTRLGVEKPEEFAAILEIYSRYPISELTIHPRVMRQQYRGQADRAAFAAALPRCTMPVCYNGDVTTAAQLHALEKEFPALSGIMVGRGLIADPALFRKARGGAPATKEELRGYLTDLYHGYTELFGSAGCILFFGVLGNYGLELQLSGAFDVVNSLSEIGPANTIVEILLTLPFGKIAVILVALLCFVFAANSYDSASYIIAANSQIRVENGESVPILRLIWAFGLSLIPIGFIILDAPLATLQTATLVLSIPIAFIIVIIGISYLKMVKEDILSGVLDQPLVVRNFSELTKTEISAKK